MNKQILLEVADKIEQTGRINMDAWHSTATTCITKKTILSNIRWEDTINNKTTAITKDKCNTVGCIAGHIVALYGEERDLSKRIEWEIEALEILQTTDANNLFFLTYWPKKYYDKYNLSVTMEERAKVVAEYIRYFVN